ncbi:hypothetical protein QE152_g4618 [Popillia japonica]|uniref:Retrovirus-related Pol polyprotein from transposon TNT 1-94-like beta-barrel domain-containing protein n=1 Tax=Popillia japonica TaxID=7064 RepID=A0AAW1MUH1_POPJA
MVKCSGNINVVTECKGQFHKVTVEDILCVPKLTTNLLSVSALISKGNRVIFMENGCSIYNRENIEIATAELIDGIKWLLHLQQRQY